MYFFEANARGIGEYGSVVFIVGNMPYETENPRRSCSNLLKAANAVCSKFIDESVQVTDYTIFKGFRGLEQTSLREGEKAFGFIRNINGAG